MSASPSIGKGFVEEYASRPNTTVIAAVRDTSTLDTKLGNVVVVKIASESETDAKDAMNLLKSQYGIEHIDVVSSFVDAR